MVAALLAIAISMIMLGALIVEIAVDGAARLFTDGSAVGREARGGAIIADLPTPAGMRWMTWALPVAILLPFTFEMNSVSAFAFLLGMFAVTTTSDTIPSVLLGIPGTAASEATVLDGYPMAMRW